MTTNLTLYAAPMSSATTVLQAFEELDIPHERELFELSSGRQRSAEFLAINPNGKVPAMTVDGQPLFEALAILQWLGDRYGVERGLWPAAGDPMRLRALSWTTWAYVACGHSIKQLFAATSEHAPAELRSEAHARHAREELAQLYRLVDDELKGRDYMLGESFTLVDLVLGCTLFFGSICGASLEGLDNLGPWLERFKARPSFAACWAM